MALITFCSGCRPAVSDAFFHVDEFIKWKVTALCAALAGAVTAAGDENR